MATAQLSDVETGKKPGDRLQCVVVTPERTLFDQVVEFVALPLYDGELGILPGRTPLIGRLGFGELRTTAGGLTHRYFVDGGFAQVRDNVVTVLTNRAIPAATIDAQAATVELEQAQARRGLSDLEQAEKNKAIERARALLRVAEHAGKR
jgi:F-type H+-transporting ATPase subunit epsilon